MSKLILMQGLPGSGKTTHAKQLAKEHGNCVRIGRDGLREMLHFGDWSGKNEAITKKAQVALVKAMLAENKVVIVDDTNIHPSRITFWEQFAKENNVQIKWHRMGTSIAECIERDAKRPHPIGKNIITAMAMQSDLYPKPLKPFVLCDLDGTLCDVRHRLHYVKKLDGEKKDWKSFFEGIPLDTVRQVVLTMLQTAIQDGHEIIFVSARPDDYRAETEKWLETFAPPYTTLLMRRNTDKRPDELVKGDIFTEYFENKYDIAFVIDDRPRVIEMWRSRGLKVVDVGGGVDF